MKLKISLGRIKRNARHPIASAQRYLKRKFRQNLPQERTGPFAGTNSASYVRTSDNAETEKLYHRIRFVFSEMRVTLFHGAESRSGQLVFNILEGEILLALEALTIAVRGCENIAIQLEGGSIWSLEQLNEEIKQREVKYFHLLIIERTADSVVPNFSSCGEITFNVWRAIESYSTMDILYESGLRNPFVARIRSKTLREGNSTCGGFQIDTRGVAAFVDFSVDAVYTWVDDSDRKWLKSKENYRDSTIAGGRANLAERFKNRDELKYSLRSLEAFAPFVRNIYIVTADQVPKWLNTDHPQVQLVSHEEIYRNAADLPTFNSSGIETQLHNIPGLSEHFLYFNDDFFLGSLCTADDFFYPNGALKYFPSEQKVYEHDADEGSEEYLLSDVNAMRLIRSKFGACGRDIMQHVPYPASISLIRQMELDFPKDFANCSSSRFRSKQDIRPISFMQYHYGVHSRSTVRSSISHRYLALWKPTIDMQLEGVLKTRKYKTFCINDVGVSADNAARVDQLVVNFLEAYFPFKSKFEV